MFDIGKYERWKTENRFHLHNMYQILLRFPKRKNNISFEQFSKFCYNNSNHSIKRM